MKGFLRHLPFSLVGEKPRRLCQREPTGLGDLVPERLRDVPEPAPDVADEKEADHFEDSLSPPGVDVADVAELLDKAPFDAVIDKVEVKRLMELSPREIEHDNPEIRRPEDMASSLGQLYNRDVTEEDIVTLIRFSEILAH